MVKVTLECTTCKCTMEFEGGGGANNYDEKIGQTVTRPCSGGCHYQSDGGLSVVPYREFKVSKCS